MPEPRIEPEPLTFEEAVDFWRDKLLVPPREFARLADEVRARAFTVAGVAKLDMLLEVWRLIDKALDEGMTLEEFRSACRELFARKGWQGPGPYRLDNIFRTNVQTAYQVGRFRQMTDPAVVEDRPYWMYDAVNDRRTRPSHAALDGMVFPANHSFWDTWYPPNGYRCRCTVRSLSERDLRRRGLTVQETVPMLQQGPDPGFGANPAKAGWSPDLGKYPEALRHAYLSHLPRRGP